MKFKEYLERKEDRQIFTALSNRPVNYKELHELTGQKKETIRQIIKSLENHGILVERVIRDKTGQHYFYIPTGDFPETPVVPMEWQETFGLIGDTHLASTYDMVPELEDFYDECVKRDVHLVFHAGDVFDGFDIYRGHNNNLKAWGVDEQIDYGLKNYPKRDGIVTKAIAGNHDLSAWKRVGIDMVRKFAMLREDFEYLGQDSAEIKLGPDFDIYLLHPAGGQAYARSYKGQRGYEQMDDRPDIFARGHLHFAMFMPYMEGNVFEVGCFQRQTPYLKRKGLRPQLGGWIVNLEKNKEKIKVNPEWISYEV